MKNPKKVLEYYLETIFNEDEKQVEKILDREKQYLKNKGLILN